MIATGLLWMRTGAVRRFSEQENYFSIHITKKEILVIQPANNFVSAVLDCWTE